MINFVGAGPGDPDLITVKGRKLLEEADVVVYTGSLVWDKHLQFCKEACRSFNSAGMTLEEIMAVMIDNDGKGKQVVRLQTGDPTLFGSIGEQMKALDQQKITYTVVPGVSSFTASCAAVGREFTLPSVSQTVIVTRIEGRTPVPEKEDLELLASHGCSMAIFLSVQEIERVVEKLIKGYGSDSVPVAIVYKATWPDQEIVRGTLKDIAQKVKAADIKRFSQILVGPFLDTEFERSLLYDPGFTHGYRKGNT